MSYPHGHTLIYNIIHVYIIINTKHILQTWRVKNGHDINTIYYLILVPNWFSKCVLIISESWLNI